MIALLLLQVMLGTLPRQAAPAMGCAAYLFTRADTPQFVAMAGPGGLRLSLDGHEVALARTGAEGSTARGLPALAHYAGGGVEATLTLAASDRGDLADGALVTEATLTVARAGADTIVAPLGGLIGCAAATAEGAADAGRRR
ncbi:hypothetical protein [Sphingomonas sp.]|uniref:hypothetical protein n=1 Tax=Sphingomonas sp. TaxID=28214 RepID=UPI003CC52B29